MTEAVVRGKTLIVTTSNGTKALLACQGAGAVYPRPRRISRVAAERGREALEGDREHPDCVCRAEWRIRS